MLLTGERIVAERKRIMRFASVSGTDIPEVDLISYLPGK